MLRTTAMSRLARVAASSSRSCSPHLAVWARTPATNAQVHRFVSTSRVLAVEVKVPSMGESISDGQLGSFSKGVGDYVQAEEEIVQVETDKVTHSIYSPEAGVISKIHFEEGDTVAPGMLLIDVDTTAEPPAGQQQPQQKAPEQQAPEQKQQEAPPQQPQAPQQQQAPPKAPTPPPPPPPKVEVKPGAASRSTTRVKMTRMRQRIAVRLKEAQNTAASLTTFNEIDMSNLIAMRAEYKDNFLETHGVKLGFMSAFVKASVAALQAQPAVNAHIEGNEIVYNDFCDVGVAVSAPNGLVVPILRNAEHLSFAGVEKSIAQFGSRARNGQLELSDLEGGTFTISNGGVFGSLYGTPILNPPQSAILGMHATKDRPVVVDGNIVIRPMMYVALTYDHRLIDGREAVTFLKTVKEHVEDPRRLLLEL